MLYYKLNDGSFLTRWKVEFDSELTSKQMKAVIEFVKKYNSSNPKWKAWTNKSLTEEKIHNWNDSFRGVNILTNNNRSLTFEFHCNPDDTKWWREWLVLKFFPDLKAKIGAFKESQILQLSLQECSLRSPTTSSYGSLCSLNPPSCPPRGGKPPSAFSSKNFCKIYQKGRG